MRLFSCQLVGGQALIVRIADVYCCTASFYVEGTPGRNGITGASGAPGVKGENGATGASGLLGPIGATGLIR